MWTVTIWGQPPSVNDIYHVVWRYDGKGRKYKGIGKTEKATQYQQDAQLQMQSARPSGWHPTGFIRLTYRFYLHNDADCDNLKKLLHDALQGATGVNDTWFLTTDQFKRSGVKMTDARVEIDVEEDREWPLLDPVSSRGGPASPLSTSSSASTGSRRS